MELSKDFYLNVINDLKSQIAQLSDQRATQVALNAEKQRIIEGLKKTNEELNEKLKNKKEG